MDRSLRHRMAGRSRSDTVTRVGAVAAAGIVVAGVAGQLTDYGLYHLRIRALDSASDGAIIGLVADAGLMGACAGAWLLALRRSPRAAEVALSSALTFLALDRVLGFHEHLSQWRLVYLPVLGATVLGLAVVGARLERVAVSVLVAGVLLLSFSLFLHELGEWLMTRLGAAPDSWLYQLKVGVKHGTEAAGWVLVALGLGHGARTRERTEPRRRVPTRRAGVPTRG
jgi:hypothetical protein